MALQYAKDQIEWRLTCFLIPGKAHTKMRYFWHQHNACNVTTAASWWYLRGAAFEEAVLALMRKRRWESLLDKILDVQTMWSKLLYLILHNFLFRSFVG